MADTQDTPPASDTPPPSDTPPSSTPRPANNPPTSDKPHPIDDLIASIRAAVAPNASADVRAIGATACRSIQTALEVQVGQPLTSAPSAPASPIAGMLSAFASMPREQLLDAVIARLRAALPPGTPTAPVTGAPRFHLIQIPQVRPPGRGA